MRELKEVLGAATDRREILVIREEYENIYERLKKEVKNNDEIGGFAVTGSVRTNAGFV